MIGSTYRFGPYCLERGAYRLSRGGEALALPPKVIDLLFLLVSRPSSLVSKDEILQALWPDVAVTDNAITQVVSELRQALDDDPAAPTYVQTVPRKGYRFIAEVERTDPAPAAGAARTESARPRTRSIAVLDFANVSGDAEVAWLGTGLCETITSDLRVIADLRVIDRALVTGADRTMSADAARAAGLDMVVAGSFQRAGPRLRITARVIDVATSEALLHAKADGEMADIFGLQDAIVRQLIAGLRLNVTPAAAARLKARETSSLEAYRALNEGRLHLEALDPAQVPAAIACFERALTFDPRYALAHAGLAHARFWRFQSQRARVHREVEELQKAIAHAEEAITIDPELAEGHASLAFFLGAVGRSVEALAAGRRAVALEPGNWRHLFRLGIAAWGEERLASMSAVVAQFPKLAYAYFAIAMVHVARADLDQAEATLRAGQASDGHDVPGLARFPASGLHWLHGLIRHAVGDAAGAEAAFERELQSKGSRLFADEYAVGAWTGLGTLKLEAGDASAAIGWFDRALDRLPQHTPALIGLSIACRQIRAGDRAAEALGRARQAAEELKQEGRLVEAALAAAAIETAADRTDRALTLLGKLLTDAPPGPAGWLTPIDPCFTPLRDAPSYRGILMRLAERAQ
ncbi:MAG TPA: winged helix-turn-helix domain-containing protein [Vicinamibacterales bacterium]|nr:winged helix-turn-helix domain-containing protein [Vicinamibacterales bacterium]